MALSTIPASMLMRRVGRRLGFMAGALIAICGSLLSALGVYQGSFWLFCLGAFVFGISSAYVQLYRFAAADVAPPAMKSRAISIVMVGDRKSTRLIQSLMRISYAVFCLKKKKKKQ